MDLDLRCHDIIDRITSALKDHKALHGSSNADTLEIPFDQGDAEVLARCGIQIIDDLEVIGGVIPAGAGKKFHAGMLAKGTQHKNAGNFTSNNQAGGLEAMTVKVRQDRPTKARDVKYGKKKNAQPLTK